MPGPQTLEARPSAVRKGRGAKQATPQAAAAAGSSSAKTERNRRRRAARSQRNKENRAYVIDQWTVSGVPNATRSGRTPNPADPRTNVKLLGRTKGGSDWCLKALHPNGEFNTMVPKIPDGAASDSVVLERRDEFVVDCPLAEEIDTWTVVLLSFPFLRGHTLAIAYASNTLTPAQLAAHLNEAFKHMGLDSDWVTYDAGVNKLYFKWLNSAVLDPVGKTEAGVNPFGNFFKTIRRVYCGYTIDFDCNTLTDKGRVTSGQFQSVVDIRALSHLVTRTATVTGGASGEKVTVSDEETYPAYSYAPPPLGTTEIVQQDLKNRQAEAKDGEYAPLRIWQPTVNFVPATAARPISIYDENFGTEDTNSAFGTEQTIWFDGWGTYVSVWSDIQRTSSLRIKRREGLELVAGYNSPYGPFNTPACSSDPIALDIMREFSRTEPHAYPADFNSHNTLQKGLFGTLGDVLGNLGLPIISDLGPLLGGVLDSILPI